MKEIGLSQILPIITLAIGSLLGSAQSFISDLFRDKRQDKREEKAHALEKESKIEERRSTLQRETLLNLQEKLFNLIKVTDLVYQEYDKSGWGNHVLNQATSDKFKNLQSEISILRVRILDNSLRSSVNKQQSIAFNLLFVKTQAIAKKLKKELAEIFVTTNEKLGKLLRELY